MKRGTRPRDPLTLNVDLDFSIRKAAIATGDTKITYLKGRQKPPEQMQLPCAVKTLLTVLNLYRRIKPMWDWIAY